MPAHTLPQIQILKCDLTQAAWLLLLPGSECCQSSAVFLRLFAAGVSVWQLWVTH